MIKYVLHPGIGDPDNTGSKRMISARELAELYEVPLSECITAANFDKKIFDQSNLDQIVHLKVDETGEYDIAKAMEDEGK